MWNKIDISEAEKYIIKDDFSLSDAFQKICENSERSGIVVDKNYKVLGTLTFGDLKRKIGYELNTKTVENSYLNLLNIINKNFYFVKNNEYINENSKHLIIPHCEKKNLYHYMSKFHLVKKFQ